MQRILLIIGLLLCAAGCASTGTLTENTTGVYTASQSKWYHTEKGVLYANDGKDWYRLVAPERAAGFIGGADVGTVEEWRKVGGGLQRYCRTPATFRNVSKQPVFIAY